MCASDIEEMREETERQKRLNFDFYRPHPKHLEFNLTQLFEHSPTYFKYSSDVRRLIYTTNPIEGFHRQVRKYTKTKGAFTSENALFKLIFCAINNIAVKWNQPLPNWALTISQLDIYFPNRLNIKW
jgi:transposase-like protein